MVGTIALGIAAVAIALLPFSGGTTINNGTGFLASAHCTAPVVSSWHSPRTRPGWFGYAPLTSTPAISARPCQTPARQRLVVAVVLAGGALLLWLLPRRRLAASGGDVQGTPGVAGT
jgi:hypothetical protein